jgi:hypothetical protein
MDKKISLDIKGAVNHYNRRSKSKTKMTLESLGKIVFKGRKISPVTMENYLSQWNSGERAKDATIKEIVRISEATGFDLCELIIIN